jgi:hypothetical protein
LPSAGGAASRMTTEQWRETVDYWRAVLCQWVCIRDRGQKCAREHRRKAAV